MSALAWLGVYLAVGATTSILACAVNAPWIEWDAPDKSARAINAGMSALLWPMFLAGGVLLLLSGVVYGLGRGLVWVAEKLRP